MKIFDEMHHDKLKDIYNVHTTTQHYIMLGEEIDLNFNSYIQPLKEFRDSYDHFMKIFHKALFEQESDENYIDGHLSRILHHEYRAFLDTASWFSIVCRDRAYKAVDNKRKSIRQIKNEFPKYSEYTDFLMRASEKIAEHRGNNDIHNGDIFTLINQYSKTLNDLYEASNYIVKATTFIENDSEIE